MGKKRLVQYLVFGIFCGHLGCASKAPLMDRSERPITKQEVRAHKNSKNFVIYALGGGALSFGGSFFLGSMLDRAVESENRSAVWITSGAGTLAGLLFFSHLGRTQDHNNAIAKISDSRKNGVLTEIDGEQEKRKQIEDETQKILEDRKRQEEERKKLLDALKKKDKKKN